MISLVAISGIHTKCSSFCQKGAVPAPAKGINHDLVQYITILFPKYFNTLCSNTLKKYHSNMTGLFLECFKGLRNVETLLQTSFPLISIGL